MRHPRHAEPGAFQAERRSILTSALTSFALILLLGVAVALVSLAHIA